MVNNPSNASDIAAVKNALTLDFLTTGPLVEEFEESLCKFTNSPTVVVSSGTAALHAAYAAIDLRPGDEVITPPITFVATQATAALMGARIVFADVQEDTFNIDPVKVEAAITPRTRAIVAVDFAGHPADLFELKEIARKNDLYLIEDAAHSLNSRYRGELVGSIADITTFSFFPTKNITSGEGGAVSSKNPELLARAKRFARQGLVREQSSFKIKNQGNWHQEVHEFGLNYRLPDVLCALGINQLKRLDSFKARRREIFAFYRERLNEIEGIKLPIEKEYVNANWHLYPIRTKAENRKKMFDYMRSNGVGVQVNYLPAYRHPVFAKSKINYEDFPNSEKFYSEEISLPMFSDLDLKSLEYVVELIRKIA